MTDVDPTEESALAHIAQLDHVTFLLAFLLMAANVVVLSRWVAAAAALLAFVTMVYDAWEFYAGRG